MDELETLIDIGVSAEKANAVLQSMSGLSSDERLEIINHVKKEKEGEKLAGEFYKELRKSGCDPKQATAIVDMAIASGSFSLGALAFKELTTSYDYETQVRQERSIFNEQMLSNGWKPIYDTLGIIYRWRHNETGRLIDDSLAYNFWLPNYQLPQSEKPILRQ